MELDFEISEEQAEQFAAELFYSSNLIDDIKQSVARSLKIRETYKGKERVYYIPFICFLDCGNTSCYYHKFNFRSFRQRYSKEIEAEKNKQKHISKKSNVSKKEGTRSPLCFLRGEYIVDAIKNYVKEE